MKTPVIIPTFKNVVVVPLKDQKTKENEAAGIIVSGPASASRKGTILAVGPDVTSLKFGDLVVFKGYGQDEVTIGAETVLVMADELIVAKIEEMEEAA